LLLFFAKTVFYSAVGFPVRFRVFFLDAAETVQMSLQICFGQEYAGAVRALIMLVRIIVLGQGVSRSSVSMDVDVYSLAVQL
jgi:hypothetical protein